jgi:hypothetical protein
VAYEDDEMTTDSATSQITLDLLTAQIKSIEAELATLRAQIEHLRATTPARSFGDLYGILAGQIDSSEEDIDAVLYRFDWEGENSDEMME